MAPLWKGPLDQTSTANALTDALTDAAQPTKFRLESLKLSLSKKLKSFWTKYN